MFDDIKEPEDIFSESDKVAPQVVPPTSPLPPSTVGVAQATEAVSQQPPQVSATQPKQTVDERIKAIADQREFPWKPIVLVITIIVIVAAAFFISTQILGSKTPITPVPPTTEQIDVEEAETVDSSSEEETINEEKEAAQIVDTDKDGLTDEEEAAAGTSPRAADTDGDGLFDYEEINTWGTNPLDPDTDKDSYLDGKEVEAGYNPKGEGKIMPTPKESD